MDFKSLDNIERKFKVMRLLTLASLGCTVLTAVLCSFLYFHYAAEQRKKVYVLDQGKSLILALQQDENANRPIEAKEHVRRFHQLFYTLPPDRSAVEQTLTSALRMADKSVSLLYSDMNAKGYYTQLMRGRVFQTLEIDSIRIDFNRYPFVARTYAKQSFNREGMVTKRRLVSECELVSSTKSDFNPQGFMIQKYKVIDNSDLGKSRQVNH